MSSAADLTAGNFQSTIDSGLTLVDFWAEWCGPCRMMSPILDELAQECGDGVTVGKVNVDNEMDIAQKYGVSSIPTLLLFKDGAEAKRFVGVTPKAELSTAIQEAQG
ncbi:MAG: thioredoxin [Nitrospiraceae bacterium]|nr:thioredoxin [Nitrospiraceae bacterium]